MCIGRYLQQGMSMTYDLPEPLSRRRRPWSNRTPFASDIGTGLALLIVEAAVFAWKFFAYGMQKWAAQGDAAEIDEIDLSLLDGIAWFLLATLILTGLAALARARWTAISQSIVTATLAVLLVLADHDYNRTHHPAPAPTPGVGYTPCYSGSGRCN
jgi:hypothetical protein